MISRSFVIALLLLPVACADAVAQASKLSLSRSDEKISVSIGDELFAEYDFANFRKPVLYPLMAPGNVMITRHYPMRDDVDAEAKDHPHHKSVWFAHGDVNGVDFWSEKGQIKLQKIHELFENGFTATHRWLSDDGRHICTDTTTIKFNASDRWRAVDYHVTVNAEAGEVTFGDTKEGTFAMRTHPALRLVDKDGKPQGSAVNSEGLEGRDVWGKRARWVHYAGYIEGQEFAITIMDHPSNLRHPTTWHAREYGLVAANPFGLHHFEQKPRGRGNHTIRVGDSLDFRYRIHITRGAMSPEQVDAAYEQYVEAK